MRTTRIAARTTSELVELVHHCPKGGATYQQSLNLSVFRLMIRMQDLLPYQIRNNTEGTLVGAKHGSPRFSQFYYLVFLFITIAHAVESNAENGVPF